MGNQHFCLLFLPYLLIGLASPASILKNASTSNSREVTTFTAETLVTEYGQQSVIDTGAFKNETVKVDSDDNPDGGIANFSRQARRGWKFWGYRGGGGYYKRRSSGASSSPWIPVIALSTFFWVALATFFPL